MSSLLALNKYTGLPPPVAVGGATPLTSDRTPRQERKGGEEEMPPPVGLAAPADR